jgi:hypothetical protein
MQKSKACQGMVDDYEIFQSEKFIKQKMAIEMMSADSRLLQLALKNIFVFHLLHC